MCKQTDRIKADLQRFQQTGELPAAWEPEPEVTDEEFDRRVDEINREMDAIESGVVEPPPGGWLNQIKVGREPRGGWAAQPEIMLAKVRRIPLSCNCDIPNQLECEQHGARE